jgi:hypothetical protein
MWVPTRNEAVDMFARHFEARHRHGAFARAKEIAASMKAKDDHDGHRIWNDVAERIDLLRQEGWRLAADVAPLAMIGPCVPQALWS